MRHRPNLAPRMEKCSTVWVTEPKELRGSWREEFPGYEALWLEIGCGKGRFTADTAEANGDILLLAVEKSADAMIKGMELVCDRGIENVRFMDIDALALRELFAPDEINRIFLNFSDPWPKSRDAKHRLTAPGFLRSYADVLPEGGEIHFKTDNRPLFDWSLEQFASEGWEIRELSNDLHANGAVGIMTDYEAKFHAQGIAINRLVAVKNGNTKSGKDGVPPRLYDSALSDARGREQKP
ncbi:MAG: tRNA (guanosine(46)-N7)-methyltransferase TrmB [Oscillospiraceae bacterium]|nr:tRNA (guanosine(46)-N7)-methyltransferase TrmB [Oscillospiraceae bacterium]